LRLKVLLKGVNAAVNLVLSLVELLLGDSVIFLGLSKVEFELCGFALTLD
jgi:hypothetical protein